MTLVIEGSQGALEEIKVVHFLKSKSEMVSAYLVSFTWHQLFVESLVESVPAGK